MVESVLANDFETHMLRIEEAMAEYAVALRAYGEWMDNWRRRQREVVDLAERKRRDEERP